jgi:hypothetical protein
VIEIIYLLGIFIAVLVNITALTLLTLRAIPFPATARVAGILIVCLVFFSLEHFIGLGDYPVFVSLTALSLYVIWNERARILDKTFKASELVFLCALLYGAMWRLAFPEIVEDNDRLTDFHLVSNYLSGERLPPVDNWLPYQRLDYYYTFQHYSAALLGRIFGLGPGVSLNFAAVILAGLVLTLAWEFLTILRARFVLKFLSVTALAIGGTGVSPLFHFITSAPPAGFLDYGSAVHALFYNSRFVGWFETSVASDTWRALFGEGTQRSVLLPIETFGYQYAIGGYHAVLSGFLLMFLALTIVAAVTQASEAVRARLEFVLGLTVSLTLCSNAWVFPLQAALVGSWKIWDRRALGHRDLRYLASGAAIGVFFQLPFLAGLSSATSYMKLQLVSLDAHTPIAQFLIVYWPLIALALAVPLVGQARSLAGFLAAFFLSLLAFTEFFNIFDEAYRDEFIRFNPALKWWGWIFTGGVFSISAFLLASNRRAARLVASIVLVLVSVFAVDAGRFLVLRSHAFAGKIDGSGFYAQDLSNARMLRYLGDAPRGIVLEKVYEEHPIDTGIYGSFAQKPSLVGIPWVLRIWKRDLTELPGLIAEIDNFYAGTHKQAARFLADHDVRYIVWSSRESKDLERWQSIMESIESDFRWMEFSSAPDSHIGLWIRR